MRYRSLGLIFAGIGFLLLLAALTSSCAPTEEPTGPVQGPPAPTAATEAPACEAPTCPPSEDFQLLEDGGSLDITYLGESMATITWKDGEFTVATKISSSSTALGEGYHSGDFFLVKDGKPIAWGHIDIVICNGLFYHNDYIITPMPQEIPEADI